MLAHADLQHRKRMTGAEWHALYGERRQAHWEFHRTVFWLQGKGKLD